MRLHMSATDLGRIESAALHRYDGKGRRLKVRTPPTNKPTDRNHLMNPQFKDRTVCGIKTTKWTRGRPGRTWCRTCLGMHPWVDVPWDRELDEKRRRHG
jgi:hypothetical protein